MLAIEAADAALDSSRRCRLEPSCVGVAVPLPPWAPPAPELVVGDPATAAAAAAAVEDKGVAGLPAAAPAVSDKGAGTNANSDAAPKCGEGEGDGCVDEMGVAARTPASAMRLSARACAEEGAEGGSCAGAGGGVQGMKAVGVADPPPAALFVRERSPMPSVTERPPPGVSAPEPAGVPGPEAYADAKAAAACAISLLDSDRCMGSGGDAIDIGAEAPGPPEGVLEPGVMVIRLGEKGLMFLRWSKAPGLPRAGEDSPGRGEGEGEGER